MKGQRMQYVHSCADSENFLGEGGRDFRVIFRFASGDSKNFTVNLRNLNFLNLPWEGGSRPPPSLDLRMVQRVYGF